MAHRISIVGLCVEVVHTGEVGYRDRLAALDDVHAHPAVRAGAPILIDFSAAIVLVSPARDAEAVEGEHIDGEHIDYMARAITHPFFDGRRVAIVGLSRRDAQPATVAAAVRKLPCRVFEQREHAIDWLSEAVASG